MFTNRLPWKVARGWRQQRKKRAEYMGRGRAKGVLKTEMSLGEEKSIWAMNLLVLDWWWKTSQQFKKKKTFKNNYPCTLASVSLEGKKKDLTIFQKYFKIAKLPSMCTLMSGPSLKCCSRLLLVLRASDAGSSLWSILGLTTSECLIT